MKKHLIRVGNSYALIIEKSIRRMLHLGPRSILDISTDGNRIVIEPTGQLLQDDEIGRARELLSVEDGMPRPKPQGGISRTALNIDGPRIWTELERRFGIGPEHVQQLHHAPAARPVSTFCRAGSLMTSPRCATHASDAELAFLRRMKVCRDRRREGATWDEAIEDALRAFPKDSAAPSPASASEPLIPAGMEALWTPAPPA